MNKTRIRVSLSFLFGVFITSAISFMVRSSEAVPASKLVSGPKRIKVPFMHMRGFGSKAGHHDKPGESLIGAGSEIEIWNIDDKRSLTITEIYFHPWDGKAPYKGSQYGLPLPLELKPNTHYHFSAFYEHFTLPPPELIEGKKNFIHGYLADIRWEGPAPRVRGWDKGVKDGEYFHVTPLTVWAE
ncbi:MAG: hypothetical protein RMM98_01810 [Acidobacteriota bacterium]|nr:hypothetical protein [Blastocatellia bacterium]MDW8238323.1 hypothetical protein [Acidobacteriota bacterium]